jgi:hypothetical protein
MALTTLVTIAGKNADMLLHKIARTLRREGLGGLWSRLRHPRRPAYDAAVLPRQTLPVHVIGADAALTAALTEALIRVLGAAAIGGPDAPTRLHLSSLPDRLALTRSDAVMFLHDRDALQALTSATAALKSCGGILLPSAPSLTAYRAAGLPDALLFLVTDPNDLAPTLARWLVAAGALRPETLDHGLFPPLRRILPQDRLCLGLPESLDRRAGFHRTGLGDIRIVDGLRLSPGWQGSGQSHALIARAALSQGAAPLFVCEDDMRPGPQFHQRLAQVEAYLAAGGWDVFSGLLTDLSDDCTIHQVRQEGALTFVHLDFTTGMVMNIYAEPALRHLAAWRPDRGGVAQDTIDAWLGRMPGLRVITTLPFLAKHDPQAVSTAFGFANRRYDSMIRASEKRLAARVARHLQDR